MSFSISQPAAAAAARAPRASTPTTLDQHRPALDQPVDGYMIHYPTASLADRQAARRSVWARRDARARAAYRRDLAACISGHGDRLLLARIAEEIAVPADGRDWHHGARVVALLNEARRRGI